MTGGAQCQRKRRRFWRLRIWVAFALQCFIVQAHSRHPTHRAHQRHACVHDTHVVPQVSKWAGQLARFELGAGDVSRRQLLATSPVPAPIRITTVFQIDNLDVPRRSFLSSVLVPAATRYLQRLYQVRYPVSGPLLLQRSCQQVLTGRWSNGTELTACSQWASLTCLESALNPDHFDAYTTCDARSLCASTPAGTGFANTDFVLYVTAKNTSVCQTGTVAYASFCTQDGATDRPTSGSANFCPDQIDPVLNWAFQLDTAVHELTHALGFSAALFKYYRDENNVPLVSRNTDNSSPQQADLSAVVRTFAERGSTATKLVTRRVTQAARAHFGCDTLNGAELENDGGPGTAGSHWEERIFRGEIMTAVTHPQAVYSKLTSAALEDSGWYVPTDDVTQPLLWGQGRGCAFPLASCVQGAPVPVDTAFAGFYCGTGFRSWTDDAGVTSSLDHMCTHDDSAVGYCQPCNTTDGTCFTDGCSPIVALSNYVCMDASLPSDSDAANSSSPAFWGQTRGVGAKCISDGSEIWSKNGFERPPVGGGCFQYECIWDVTGTQATLTFLVGGHPITCIDGQEVSLATAGFVSGSLGPCPVANTFCADGGCVNDCSSKGVCTGGTCKCLIGWAGTDCSQLQCNDGVCPSGYVCDALSGVCLTATLSPSPSPSSLPATNIQPGPSFSPVPFPSRSPLPSASPSASALPASASPSPSVRPSPSPRPLTAPTTVSGIAFDGYFVNCTLCMDANNNRRCDPFEATTVSNGAGAFRFEQVTVNNYGPVLLWLGNLSCVDSLTNLLPTTIMIAPMGSLIVSPITTFVQALMDVGDLSLNEAESTAKVALGLPSTAQILSGDPIQGLLLGASGGLRVLKAVAVLNNVAAQFGALLAEVSKSRGPSVSTAFSLSVYRAMATLTLSAEAPLSPAKASRVPSSATGLSSVTSLADGSNCSRDPTSWIGSGPGCSLDLKKPSPGNPAATPLQRPEGRNLADVSPRASLNISDASTLHDILDASVADAQASGAIEAGADVSADVASSVVSLAANSNALVAAVALGDGSQSLQTLSQIGATARGSILESIQEMGAGNITVSTFAANSAPERLALIAAHTKVMSALTPAAASAPPPVTSSPPTAAPVAAAATVVQAAGNGIFLIAGLLVGLFFVLGAAIGFIFWQYRRMQRERAESREGLKPLSDREFRKDLKGSRRWQSRRRSRQVSEGGDSGAERETEDESLPTSEGDRYDSGAEQSELDENGTATGSVLSYRSIIESRTEWEADYGRRQQQRDGEYSDGTEGSDSQSDGQEELRWVQKRPRKQLTRGRPHLDPSRRRSAENSENEDLDKALVLNRGDSTAVELSKPGRNSPGFRNSHGDRGPGGRKKGSYIYAPQQIIIINQGQGSESEPRSQKPQTPRYGPPRNVPAIAATSTATLALELAPHDLDVGPYVTAPSVEESQGERLVVTEVRDGSASEDGFASEAEQVESRNLDRGTKQTQRMEKATGADDRERPEVPLRSGAVLPGANGRNENPQTSRPVKGSFTPTEDGLMLSKPGSSQPHPLRRNVTPEPTPSSRTALPVKESFVVAESPSGNPLLVSRLAPIISVSPPKKTVPALAERPIIDEHAVDGNPPRVGAGAQVAGSSKSTSPVRRPVPQPKANSATGIVPVENSSTPPTNPSKPVASFGKESVLAPTLRQESLPTARPESAPARPAEKRNPEAAPSGRPKSALPEGDKPGTDARQVSPQRRVLQPPAKPAWEEEQLRRGGDQRQPKEVVTLSGRIDGVALRQQSPVRIQSRGVFAPRKPPHLAQPIVKRVPEASVPHSMTKAATASFTFDVEESPLGRLSRSPSGLPEVSNFGSDNPPSSSFATVSLALMKKAAPADVSKQPSQGRPPAGAKSGSEEKVEPVMAAIKVVSATLSRSPTRNRPDRTLAKDPSSPQRKRPTGGEAGSASGSDQAARSGSPRKVPAGQAPGNRAVGPENGKGIPAAKAEVIVDLRKVQDRSLGKSGVSR